MQNNYKKIYQTFLFIVIFGVIIYSKYPSQGGVIIYGDIQQSHIFGGESFGYYLKYFNGDTNLQWFMHPLFEIYMFFIRNIFKDVSVISKLYIFSSYLVLYFSVFKYCEYKTKNYFYSLSLAIFSICHPIIDTYHSNILVIYSFGFFIAACLSLQYLIKKY